jgi:hypothetical protein
MVYAPRMRPLLALFTRSSLVLCPPPPPPPHAPLRAPPGLPDVLSGLLQGECALRDVPMPRQFWEKPFESLFGHMLESGQGIVVALYVSADSSAASNVVKRSYSEGSGVGGTPTSDSVGTKIRRRLSVKAPTPKEPARKRAPSLQFADTPPVSLPVLITNPAKTYVCKKGDTVVIVPAPGQFPQWGGVGTDRSREWEGGAANTDKTKKKSKTTTTTTTTKDSQHAPLPSAHLLNRSSGSGSALFAEGLRRTGSQIPGNPRSASRRMNRSATAPPTRQTLSRGGSVEEIFC